MLSIIGLAETPREIAGLLDLRRRELGLTCLATDEITGLQSGYSVKIFNAIKNLGQVSMPALLGALGAKVVVVCDDNWLPPVTMRHVGCVKSTSSWARPPRLLPPPGSVFVPIPGLPAPRDEAPAVIELTHWTRSDE
jgi:hypothetical protein